MKSYFIFINLISLAIQRDFKLLFKKLYNNNNENEKINIDYCKQIDKNSFNYKEISIKNILNNKRTNDLNKYKYVYIPEVDFLEKITLFPKSTVFFIPESILNNSSIYTNDYCIIKLDNKYEKNIPFYFLSNEGEEFSSKNLDIIIRILVILYILLIPISLIITFKSCCLKPLNDTFIFILSRTTVIFNNLFPETCLFIEFSLFPYIIYCIYKTFIYTCLFFLVNGFTILNNENLWRFSFGKSLLIFMIFDSIISFIFLYLIPFNNFYLFAIKNWIYNILLLIFTIKSIKNKLIPLYRQLRFEQLLRTFFAIGYKAKLIIFIKVILFSLLYSLTFIILPFLQIIYINKYKKAFHINYYINIACEMSFSIILAILFYPTKITIFFYLPVIYDYNSRYFSTKISKTNEKINNFSNLTKKDLKKKYSPKRIPIVLIKPFNIKDNSYNDIFIGIVEDKKIN